MDKSDRPQNDIAGLVQQLRELIGELTAVHSELYWLAMKA
jgi:hypothetical protein